jgi:hypothetical protein
MSNAKTILNHNILYESATVCIYFDFLDDWLYVDWIGEQTVESIKEGCEQLLLLLKAERTHKLLNDNTRVTNIWSDAAEWIATDFAPRCAYAGLEYVAWVYSPDQFSRLSADEVMERHITSTVTIAFDDIEAASQWLRSV